MADVAVRFDGLMAAGRVYEDMRREQPKGAQMPPWGTLSRAEHSFFAYFADLVVMDFLNQMSAAGLKIESHFIPAGGKS